MSARQRLYERLPVRSRALVDRARFAAGMLPRVEPRGPGAPGLPPPHDWCLTVSADLELAWAWRYARISEDAKETALHLGRRSRVSMPALLDLFRAADTPVTWATVGHLFLDSCGERHPEIARLPYFEHDLWRFSQGDWFDDDPCTDVHRDPEWYGPDILDAIAAADPRHEIGSHSFSHVDLSDAVCPPDVARDELAACAAAARARGVTLETLVFPGNRHGNFRALADAGYRGYRLHTRDHLRLPRRDEHGMWQIPGGLCWELPPGWTAKAWIAALKRSVDRAADNGTILHLWFHPSCEPVNVEEVFPAVLDYAGAVGKSAWRPTMREIVAWCSHGEG